MKNLLTALIVCMAISHSVFAQNKEMTPIEAQQLINEKFLTDDVVTVSASLKQHVDYIADNYEEGELRDIIRNAEEVERKIAKRLERTYEPYDRRINVKRPQDVKRYFRKRLDAIY